METMVCICKHGERYHKGAAPYGCIVPNCGCEHFRWTHLDWNAPPLVDLVIERAAS